MDSDKPRRGEGVKEEKRKLLLEDEVKEKYGSFPLQAVPSTSYQPSSVGGVGGTRRRVSKTRQREIVFVVVLCCFVSIMLGLIFGLPPFLPYKVQFRFRRGVAVADSPHCSAIGSG